MFRGDLIREWRKKNHISQEECARRACITQAYWNALELGNRTPSLEVLSVISDVTGISKSKLIGDSNPPKPSTQSGKKDKSRAKRKKAA